MKNEEEKKYFYATLADLFGPSMGSIRIVLGNLSAKFGRKAEYRNWIGTESLHAIINDNGSKFIDFLVRKGLVIKSTIFPRKDIYIYV